MSRALKTTTRLMAVEDGGITVTVALKNGDANGTREFQRLLTSVLETIGWAGADVRLAEAVESCARRASGPQPTGPTLTEPDRYCLSITAVPSTGWPSGLVPLTWPVNVFPSEANIMWIVVISFPPLEY